MIKLSILIATMPDRGRQLCELMSVLLPQVVDHVEVLQDQCMSYNIGTKRNILLGRARGNHIVFIDDDDSVSKDYVSKILDACRWNPDCVGISGIMTTNGSNQKQWHISKQYGRWFEQYGIYYRTPNHISPVRRSIALRAGFPEVSHGEDAEYSRRLLPMLQSEIRIPGNIYHYKYDNTK